MRRTVVLRPVAALVAAAGMLLATYGVSGVGAAARPHAAPKSDITYALDETIPGFNVLTSADSEFVLQEVLNLVWPQVFVPNAQLKLGLDTDFVTSATQTSTSPQTIVYKINPKAKWSDGQPIDFEDFYYNWAAQSGGASFKDITGAAFDDATNTGYSQVKSITGSAPPGGAACASVTITHIGTIPCANGDTVKIVFSTPFADWKSLFAPIVPAHVAAKVGWNTGFQSWKNVVSGAWYEFSNYVQDQYLVLKRNPTYWGTPGKLGSFTFQIFNGDTQAVPAMQNGEVQVINPLETDLSVVQQADQLTGVNKSLIGGLEFQHLDFNETDPYLAVKSVRQAIAYGTNRSEIVQRTVGEFDKSIIPLGNRMLMPNQPGYVNEGKAYNSVNVSKAKSLLTGAGMTMSSDGYFHPKSGPQAGKPLTFTINSTSGNTLRSNIEQVFQSNMKAIGIKILIANQTASTLFGTTLPKGEYQIGLFAWVATPFVSGNLAIYCSYTGGAACGENWTHFADPKVDAAMKAGAVAANQTTEIADFNKADSLLWSDMDTLPLFQAPVFTVWSTKFTGIIPNSSNVGITWNAQTWKAA